MADQHNDLLHLTADIVSSYILNRDIGIDDIEDLLKTVYASLESLDEGKRPVGSTSREPAVPIEESITPDYLICLEDGKQFKLLKRHLKATYNLTPEEYRKRWSLPPDYPMVAPNYAKKRSRLAKEIGLGKNN